ncbi:MAG: transposase [Patescibacteria group bacterium]
MTLKKMYLPEQYYFITTNIFNKEWVFGKLKHGIYEPNERLCATIIKTLNDLRKILGFLISGYVIMPDHVHLILKTAEDESSVTRFRDGFVPAHVGEKSFSTMLKQSAEDESSATRRKSMEDESSASRFEDRFISTRVGENSFSPCYNISQIMKSIKGKSARIINDILGKNGQLWQHSFYEHGIRNDQDFVEKLNYLHLNPLRADLVKDQSDFKYSSYQNYHLNDNSIIKIDQIDL